MISSVIRKLRIANIYPAYILSIPVSFIFLVSLFISFFYEIFIIPTLFAALAYLIINYSLFSFFRREEGTVFLLKAIPLSWVDYLISGLGVLTGGMGLLGQSIVKAASKIGWGVDLREYYHRLVNGKANN